MKYLNLFLLTILLTILSCNKEDLGEGLEDFLLIEHLPLEELMGEWDWDNSNGGWGMTITPETEGYQKTITFGAERVYKEYIDSKLTLETHFRIDTAIGKMHHNDRYTIHYFGDKEEQDLIFDQIDGVSGLFLYDTGCRDCVSTHVFLRK